MQIDPTKSALQNLLDLVDSKNAQGPTNENQVTASNLQAATSGTDAAVNSSVQLTGVEAHGFTGTQTYQYGRLSLAAEAAAPAGPVPIPKAASDVLGVVASYFGFIKSEVSFTATPVAPDPLPGSTTSTLQATGSLVYLDGTVDVTLSWLNNLTALLMHFDGTTPEEVATDAAGHTVTVHGDAGTHQNDTAIFSQAYWGNSNGSYFEVADAPDLHFSGDLTFEFFSYVAAFTGTFISKGSAKIYLENTGAISVVGDSGAIILSGQTSAAQQWADYVLLRSGNEWSLYQNGTQIATATSTDTWGVNSDPLIIGNDAATDFASPIVAYMDEMRLSQTARYTSTTVVNPSAPFTFD